MKRGQSMVLLALFVFLLATMVLLTLSLGAEAARKTDLNNAADAAAYSSAVATARTFNSAAVVNRAIVSNYLAMASLQAQMAYASQANNYFNMAALMARMLDQQPTVKDGVRGIYFSDAALGLVPTLGDASRTWQTREASYTLWHIALSFYRPGPGNSMVPGDNLNVDCQGSGTGNCRPPGSGPGGAMWQAQNLALLEQQAGLKLHEYHQAIETLAQAQRENFRQLQNQHQQQRFARQVLRGMGLSGRQVMRAEELASTEGRNATDSRNSDADSRHGPEFQRAFTEAILGSRPNEPLLLPRTAADADDRIAPVVQSLLGVARANLGPRFTLNFTRGDTSADLVNESASAGDQFGWRYINQYEEPIAADEAQRQLPGMDALFGRYQNGTVTLSYDDPAAGWRTLTSPGSSRPQPDPLTGSNFYPADNMSIVLRTTENFGNHRDYESRRIDGQHWGDTDDEPNGFGCHGNHAHYGADQSARQVHGLDRKLLPADVLSFVLPKWSEQGARGLWGQPKQPVLLEVRRPANDPWARNFTFAFEASGSGQTLDTTGEGRQVSLSAGLTYYHHREHLGEPPNLLNPYWHATLAPMELDERDWMEDWSHDQPQPMLPRSTLQALQPSGLTAAQKQQYRQAYGTDARPGLADIVQGMRPHPMDD